MQIAWLSLLLRSADPYLPRPSIPDSRLPEFANIHKVSVRFPPIADIAISPVSVRRAPVPAALGLQRRRVPGPLSAANFAVDGEELRIDIFV